MGVFGFVVSLGDFVVDFVVDFLFCLWECVPQRKKQMMRVLVVQMEKREKKMSENKIIIIMYRQATVTVYICTVTVAHGNF